MFWPITSYSLHNHFLFSERCHSLCSSLPLNIPKVDFVFVESSFSPRSGKAGGNSPGSWADLLVTGHLVLKHRGERGMKK